MAVQAKTSTHAPIRAPKGTGRMFSPLFMVWIGGLALVLLFGVGCGIYVAANGLGVTNLRDELPWGLWITIDLSSVALGAGAFTLSTAVYVFGMKRFESIARAAVFIGLLGYTSAMMALFVDIGRFDRFYHPILYWNMQSVLWDITICVFLYFTVILVELIPVFIESTPLDRIPLFHMIAHLLERIMPFVAVVGLGISLLGQSLYGATYGILTARPVWFSPSAPVLFILSAVAAGPALTLFVTLVAGKLLNKVMVPQDVVDTVARFIGFACLAYVYLKLWSWLSINFYTRVPEQAADAGILAQNTPYNFTFWFGEVLFGALVPAFIMLWGRTRRNRNALMLGAVMIIAGLVINRWNITLAGFVVPLDWSPGVGDVFPLNRYEPSLVEWGIAFGIVAYSWLAFSLGVRFLNLYPEARDRISPKRAVPVAASETVVATTLPATLETPTETVNVSETDV